MNKLSIRYLFPEDPDALSLFESLNELQEAIRQRAFDLVAARGTTHGGDMEDWLRAERELVWVPQSETMEDDKQIRLRLIVPGLEAQDLQITAMPDEADGVYRVGWASSLPVRASRLNHPDVGLTHSPRMALKLTFAGCCAGRAARQAGRPPYPRHSECRRRFLFSTLRGGRTKYRSCSASSSSSPKVSSATRGCGGI